MKRRTGWLRWVVAAVVASLLVAALVAVPNAMERAVRRQVLPRVASKLGLDVTAAEVDAGWGSVELRGVAVGDVVMVPRVTVRYALGAALLGNIDVVQVVVHAPAITIEVRPDGSSNLDPIMQRFRAAPGASPTASAGSSTRLPRALLVQGATVRVSDRRQGWVLDISGLALNVAPRTKTGSGRFATLAAHAARGPRLSLADVNFEVARDETVDVKIGDGAIELWPGFALTNLSGTLGSARRATLTLALAGSYGGAKLPLWTAAGALDLNAWQGEVTIAASEFSLGRLAAVLPANMFPDIDKTLIDASLKLSLRDKRITYEGQSHVSGLSLSHPMLASEPLVGIDLASEFGGWLDWPTRELVLREARFVTREVPLVLRGNVLFAHASRVAADGTPQPLAMLTAQASVPSTPCQQVLEAIPSAIAPFLREFKLQGDFAAEVDLAIDWNNLDALALRADIGMNRCKVLKAPQAVGERLRGEFTHHVEIEQNEWMSFVVGPSNPDFVPYAALPPHVVYAAMTTEDPRFFKHHGFLPSEFEKALAANLKVGYFRLGASPMTMQLVKNVLLYREKTLSRKFQELFLTWHIEQVLTKERMLEIYFNVVEYGPAIYGVTAAAREYFAKPVAELTLKEAVFLAKLLPSPKARYRQLCEGTLRKWMEDGIGLALERMLQKTWITPNEYEAALTTPLVFATRNESREQCLARVKTAIQKARPTTPRAPRPPARP
ncbi:MAG: transglycosylase domain-containing protein [Myxococcales bacterium]|nr:transglycosylase domain-containing protein [Myxococcales bacterium]